MKRAARMEGIAGFGIDRVAAAVLDGDVLRLENLDTDLGLPPEAMSVTRAALDDPVSNSWLPFTGDLGLRAAISDHIAARHGRVYDPEREIVVTCGGTEGVLDVLLATLDPGDEVVLTDPTYAGLVNRVRLAGGVPVCAPLAVVDGEWQLDRDALAAAVTERTVALLMMSPSMPSGCVLVARGLGVRRLAVRRARPVPALRRRDGGAALRRPRAGLAARRIPGWRSGR